MSPPGVSRKFFPPARMRRRSFTLLSIGDSYGSPDWGTGSRPGEVPGLSAPAGAAPDGLPLARQVRSLGGGSANAVRGAPGDPAITGTQRGCDPRLVAQGAGSQPGR